MPTQARWHFKRKEARSPQTHEPSGKSSTAYSDEWANELLSINQILDQEMEDDQYHRSESALDEPARAPKVQTMADVGRHTTEKPKLADPGSEDIELSHDIGAAYDTEDALVGLSDSVTMQRKSNSRDPEEATSRMQYLLPQIDSSEKLFLSTDSPEKLPGPERQPASSADSLASGSAIADEGTRENMAKGANAPPSPSDNEHKQEADAPIIRPGQPSWVYDFDPAFVAEYQDYVEFV